MKPKKQQTSQVLTLDQIKEVVKNLLSEQDKRFDKKLDESIKTALFAQDKRFDKKLQSKFEENNKEMDKKFQKARKDQSKVMFEYFVTKDEFNKEINELKQLIKFLPSTELYLSKMADLVSEQQTLRNNDDILNDRTSDHTNQLDNHEERIAKLEQRPFLTT